MSEFELQEDAARDGIRIFRVSGDVDFGVAPTLKRRLTEAVAAGARQIVLDLTATGFVDSTAIGVLVGALRRLHDLGGSLVVVCDNDDVRDIFAAVGLEDMIAPHRTASAALGELVVTA